MTQHFKLVSAVHLFLFQQDKLLLARRYNTGYEDGNYSVVAGHLDGNEEIIAAMIREAQEEVGITIAPSQITIVGVMHRKAESPGDDERIDFFLTASSWSGEITNCEPDKCDQLLWCDPDDLPANMVPYVRRGLENYRQGRWFDSYGWHTQR